MRTIRLIAALLVAASLVILPVATGMGMTFAAKAEMNMGAPGSDCPCCDPSNMCATHHCMFVCYNMAAIAVEGLLEGKPLPQDLVAAGPASFSPFPPRPDPPPPRS